MTSFSFPLQTKLSISPNIILFTFFVKELVHLLAHVSRDLSDSISLLISSRPINPANSDISFLFISSWGTHRLMCFVEILKTTILSTFLMVSSSNSSVSDSHYFFNQRLHARVFFCSGLIHIAFSITLHSPTQFFLGSSLFFRALGRFPVLLPVATIGGPVLGFLPPRKPR